MFDSVSMFQCLCSVCLHSIGCGRPCSSFLLRMRHFRCRTLHEIYRYFQEVFVCVSSQSVVWQSFSSFLLRIRHFTCRTLYETTRPVSQTTRPVSQTTRPVSQTTRPVSQTTRPVSQTTRSVRHKPIPR